MSTDVIDRYFAVSADQDLDALMALFTDDATVLDEGHVYRGAAAIRDWRDGAASAYEYTSEILADDALGADSRRVTVRLDGNFPGGTAELHMDFTVAQGRIAHLAIAP